MQKKEAELFPTGKLADIRLKVTRLSLLHPGRLLFGRVFRAAPTQVYLCVSHAFFIQKNNQFPRRLAAAWRGVA